MCFSLLFLEHGREKANQKKKRKIILELLCHANEKISVNEKKSPSREAETKVSHEERIAYNCHLDSHEFCVSYGTCWHWLKWLWRAKLASSY